MRIKGSLSFGITGTRGSFLLIFKRGRRRRRRKKR
jgi:hypothetical protein